MAEAPVQTYLDALQREYKTEQAGEHGYRHALKALLEGFENNTQIHAINEPRNIACGAPDFVVQRKGMPLGYIEAKDIGKDLNNKQYREQFDRYKAGLGNLIITDYLVFWWFVDGELRHEVEFAKQGPNRKLILADGGEENLSGLLDSFLHQKPLKIGRPKPLAVRLANLALIIRELIEKSLAQDSTNGERKSSTLHEQLGGFRNVLMATLTEADFADMYAQTIVYGMFAARENHRDPNAPFSRFTAAFDLPKTNPFLRQLFNYIAGPDLDKRLEWAILDLADLLDVVDMGEIRTEFAVHKPGDDPVVHFYETFLAEYDPKKREMRGVYYTPQPVVGYIVRSIDELLKSEFGLKAGLADHAKTTMQVRKAGNGEMEEREVHRVQILDPACGTGSFLLRVIDEIHATFKGDEGSWPGYVREHLLPRLHGFELMMAPYTVAHMKIGMRLKNELDAGLRDDERLGIYLTNTIENPHDAPPRDFFVPWLVDEAEAAWRVKSQQPILVILGNPPYSGHSANTGQWMKDLLRGRDRGTDVPGNYFQVDGKPLGERNPKWLNDDYVKFLRWAQWRIERSGQGIVGMITNHGYLDNPTFRGMRQSLMQTFDKMYILDLHGNDRKKERVPEEVQKLLGIGPKDENVFDIQQGVAICLLVKLPESRRGEAMLRPSPVGRTAVSAIDPDSPKNQTRAKHGFAPTKKDDAGSQTRPTNLGQVFHSEIWGDRKRKYAELEWKNIAKEKWEQTKSGTPNYFFFKQSLINYDEYMFGSRITDFTLEYSVGIATGGDQEAIFFDDISAFRKAVKVKISEDDVQPIHYRPFDQRHIVYNSELVTRMRSAVMQHLFSPTKNRENLSFITSRLTKGEKFAHVQVSTGLSEVICMSPKTSNNGFAFPLYLYPVKDTDPVTDAPGGRRPNLSDEFIKEFTAKLNAGGGAKMKFIINGRGDLKKTYGPEDVFNYMYAVFHSPTYRKRYADFLKIDFPRLPLTTNRKLLRKLCALGHSLVRLHLMDASAIDTENFPLPKYPIKPDGAVPAKTVDGNIDMNLHEGGGGDIVEKVRYSEAKSGGRDAAATSGCVWINKHQYFEGVAQEVWNFHVGGYQVCEKWLKDRKGRELSFDDKNHYKQVVSILGQTIKVMAQIDKVISKNGGWPIS